MWVMGFFIYSSPSFIRAYTKRPRPPTHDHAQHPPQIHKVRPDLFPWATYLFWGWIGDVDITGSNKGWPTQRHPSISVHMIGMVDVVVDAAHPISSSALAMAS